MAISAEYREAVNANRTLARRGLISFDSPEQIEASYRAGLCGSICDHEDQARLVDEGLLPVFEDVAECMSGSLAAEEALLHQYLMQLDPFAFTERQTTGDCFVAGTLVAMADGSEKPIESVVPGEFVITAANTRRVVLRTIRKHYEGPLVDLRVAGYSHTITCTPDHRFVTLPKLWDRGVRNTESRWRRRSEQQAWRSAADIEVGSFLLMPHCDPGEAAQQREYDLLTFLDGYRLEPVGIGRVRQSSSKRSVIRHVVLSERLSWLLGLYAAEGGVSNQGGRPIKLTVSLSAKETLLAETAAQALLDIFGVACSIDSLPSKPNVLQLNCHSGVVAGFFKQLIPGNTYNKTIPAEVFVSNRATRLAFLRGWMDGDGHLQVSRKGYGACKLTGVSVSHSLARGAFRLANSCGLKASLTTRKPRGRSKEASDVHLYGVNALAVYPERRAEVERRVKLLARHPQLVEDGLAVGVQSISQRHATCDVYCLEVASEHSFIANGVAVHNCVSHATRNAIDIARAVEILVKGEPEEFVARSATEAIYGSRGHGGQGMSCSGATRFVSSEGGILLRQPYPDLGIDFSVYNAQTGSDWGRRGVPQAVKDEGKKHQTVYTALLTTLEGVKRALASGNGVHCCSSFGFESERDEHGFSQPRGSWNHDMAWVAFSDEIEGVLIPNSWGPRWNRGPRIKGQPEGSFWVKYVVIERMLKAGGTYAVGNTHGWPARRLPDLGGGRWNASNHNYARN